MSGVPNSGIVIAQWTTGATARDTYVMLGFVPDFVMAFINHGSTNPDILFWFNKGGQTLPTSQTAPGSTSSTAPSVISQWLDANDHIKLTGDTSGGTDALTRVTTGIAAYFGSDPLTADKTIDSNPTYVFPDGTFGQSGQVTSAGILVPNGVLTANGLNLVVAFRQSGAITPAGF